MTLTPESRSNSNGSVKHKYSDGLPFSMEVEEAPILAGEGKPRRHPLFVSRDLVRTYREGIATLYDVFVHAISEYKNSNFLGWRPKVDGRCGPYQFMTYGVVGERVANLAAGLASFDLPKNSNVGIYSINRPEWVMAEYACYFNSYVTVPLYDTLGDDALEFICDQTDLNVLFASNDKALNILRLKEKLPTLKTIICMDEDISEELMQKGTKLNVELVWFGSVEKRGRDNPREPTPPTPEDLCTVCYTSGTTGMPKGVMLPHKALLSDASSIMALSGVGVNIPAGIDLLFPVDANMVHISYLPLAHVYERICMTTLAAVGGTVGFYQGDILKLMDDIAELRPTIFVTVPRLLNRIYDKVLAGVSASSNLKKFLFNFAFKTKVSNLSKGGQYQHWLWDRLVFNALRQRLGGRVKVIMTGSAPLSPEVMDFMRICFSCAVHEGYGQTETSAGSTVTLHGDCKSGYVGVPLPCNEVKLVDIPDMGYATANRPNPRGEICIRGNNCFTGYYKLPELTKETLDTDGWVHTGDVGEWDELGRLKVIDRKKNLFKLAQGEYISPEKIENILVRNKYIAQMFVDGNSLKSFLVAIVVPDFEVLEVWAGQMGIEYKDQADLAAKPKVKELLISEIKAFGRAGSNDLKGFEIPKEIHVEPVMFSVDNGLLTSAFKLKRFQAKKQYGAKIAEMYEKTNEQSSNYC